MTLKSVLGRSLIWEYLLGAVLGPLSNPLRRHIAIKEATRRFAHIHQFIAECNESLAKYLPAIRWLGSIPTLRKQTIYVALMLLGIGAMLIAAGSSTNDTATAIQGWGAAFIVLSVVPLIVVGVSAAAGKLFGIISRDRKAEMAKNSNDSPSTSEAPNPPDGNELSDTERALLKLLRNNDIPPDVVAESIREVLERRMGR